MYRKCNFNIFIPRKLFPFFVVILILAIFVLLDTNHVLKILTVKSKYRPVISDEVTILKDWLPMRYNVYDVHQDHSDNAGGIKTTAAETSDTRNNTIQIESKENNKANVLPLCPENPPRITNKFIVNKSSPSFRYLEKEFPTLLLGGRYRPPDCIARHRVAIIVPYRNRENNLKTFLKNLHPFLQRQQLDYGIFIIEQAYGSKFNRGMLLNIGYIEALKLYDYQCFVFHDIDKIPMDLRNIYSCPTQPRHLSIGIDYYKFKLPYADNFGGVTVLTKAQFKKVNGFSNMYFGWGLEDDDFYRRVKSKGYAVTRYATLIGRYASSYHKPDKGNELNKDRMRLLERQRDIYAKDGLNSIKYKLLEINLEKLYTRVYVSINEAEVKEGYK